MTEFSWEERHKYCDELSNFLDDTENHVKEVCLSLGWSFDSIKNDESYLTCPFNEGHRVPERTIQKHLEKCEWNTLGYTKDCKPLPEPTLPSQSPSTIEFDIQLQHQILQEAKQKNPELNIGDDERLIPQTSDRLTSDFTSDERKAMYEYVIAHTIAPDIGQHDITDINKPEKSNVISTPIIELLAQERNLKRRRAKHRGVHTNKKSQTEILREVIVQQMEMYKEYLSDKLGIPIADLNDENNFNSQCIDNIKREKSVDEVDQYRDYKNTSGGNSKYYDKDYYSTSRKNINRHHFNNDESFSKNQDLWDSYKNNYDKNHDKYESRKYDKNDFPEKKRHDSDYYSRKHGGSSSRDRKRNDHSSSRERKRDDYESRNIKRDHSDPRDGKRNDCQSRDKNRDDSNSRKKKRDDNDISNRKREENVSSDTHPEYDNSHDHKHYVTKASEKPFDSKSEEYYEERKTHQKYKKDSKKRKDHKRDRSRDSDDDRKRKISKHNKRDKHRSRSRSRR